MLRSVHFSSFLNVHPISVSTPNDIALNLVQQFGFHFDCLPKEIGGFWDYDTYFLWLRTVASVTQCRLALFDSADDMIRTTASQYKNIISPIPRCEPSPTGYSVITPIATCCQSFSVNEIATFNNLEYQEPNEEHSSPAGTINVKAVLNIKHKQLCDSSDTVPFLASDDELLTKQDLKETAIFCDDDHNWHNDITKNICNFECDNSPATAVVSQNHRTGTIMMSPTNLLSPYPSDDDTRVVPIQTSSYWTLRKELFGDDRYKLPMNQTGSKYTINDLISF